MIGVLVWCQKLRARKLAKKADDEEQRQGDGAETKLLADQQGISKSDPSDLIDPTDPTPTPAPGSVMHVVVSVCLALSVL